MISSDAGNVLLLIDLLILWVCLFFNEFVVGLERSPDVVAHLRVHLLQGVVELFDVRAMRVGLIGAELLLFLIPLHLGPRLDVALRDEAQRADDGERHLAHLQTGGHRGEVSLISEVHQCRMDEVVLMMPEGDLVTAEFLCEVEELFASIPRTEEAGLLLFSFY